MPLRHPRPQSLAALALAAMGLALGACSNSDAGAVKADATQPEKPAATPAADAIPVETVRPTRTDMVARHDGTATLEAEADAEVVARVGGQVMRLVVEEGQRVRAGQLLAILDQRQLRLEAAQAQAQFAKVESDYRRQVELHQKGLIAAGAFEGSRFDLAQRRAAYELASLQLSYSELRAPFDGVVAERRVRTGQNVAAGTTAFRIVDNSRLRAQVFVPERQLERLRPGQTALVSVDALPGRHFPARVALVSPTVDARTATFKVTLDVPDPRGDLKPGMFARVGVVFEKRSRVLAIPGAALVENQAEPTVYVIEAGRAAPRRLRLGLNDDGRVEVLSGLKGDEQIVITGQNGLKAGHAVRVVTLAAGTTAAAG